MVAIQNHLFLFLVFVTMALALANERVEYFQCGCCATRVIVDGTRCQMTRDCKGQFAPCNLEEVAWYRAEIALFKHGKACCNNCIQPWHSWKIKRGNKIACFMKYNTCEGCTVQCTVDAKYTHTLSLMQLYQRLLLLLLLLQLRLHQRHISSRLRIHQHHRRRSRRTLIKR